MYEKVNITENSLQILSLFTRGFDREYYIREVQKILKISPRTAQLLLEDLENKGILESKVRGKIKTYKLKRNNVSRKYLTFVEQYKEISFTTKNILIKEIIEKITPHMQGIALVFGSYAKGTAHKESDLDIFIAGTYDSEEIKKVSKMYGVDVSVKCYPMKIFEKNITTDILLKEIVNDHIIFLNAEQFVQKVVMHG